MNSTNNNEFYSVLEKFGEVVYYFTKNPDMLARVIEIPNKTDSVNELQAEGLSIPERVVSTSVKENNDVKITKDAVLTEAKRVQTMYGNTAVIHILKSFNATRFVDVEESEYTDLYNAFKNYSK